MRRKELLLYIVIILFLTLVCISNGLFLNDTDGTAHYNFYKNGGCETGLYANSVCSVAGVFGDISEVQFWSIWLIVLFSIPVLLFYFFRNWAILPGFFIFTGLFFSLQSMQTYAQLIALVGFILLVFSKSGKHKIAVIGIFLFLDYFAIFVIHSQFNYILYAALLIELLVIFKNTYMAPAAMFIPQLISDIRYNVYGKGPSADNIFYFLIYYGYTFFVEYMFFGFTIPGLVQLIKHGKRRHLFYFCFIIFGAMFYWVYEAFNVWRVTRVLIFFPIIILPYFIEWLSKQPIKTQRIFWIVGGCYFIWNVFYFLAKQ